ncbi:mRNA interferase HicA [Pasteurella testudinis DSM 23072]|uniref:mRNA interferase HicA n=1 Tax=Pasteurella testudinis DSM 23072 TaxID=1122938 RepID=A0A1W1UW03_9PAST|nr:type II toxin-antitoxin system HicA family toxin [Pasteurella testudinis]SMB85338.1 mRNA interferase HicA [Pasteurella testudinis DSM 23072]SUB51296.1 YcfA-like protein [Pasteurella testudinis]
MKYSEFLRYLLSQGAQVETPRRGSHRKVTLNGKQTIFPYHGSKEIGTGLVNKIKKDLDLK